MPDDPDLLPPGHPMLPAALDHVTPGFRGLWFAGDPTTLAHGPRIGVIGSRHPRSDAADAARSEGRGLWGVCDGPDQPLDAGR